MRFRLVRASLLVCFAVGMALAFTRQSALAGNSKLKFEVILVWGTNDKQSPDPNHKPVDADIDKELKKLFKWANYFEVNRKQFELPSTGVTNVPVSEKCQIEVKRLQGSDLEVSYIGKGKPVYKRIVNLPKGEILVYGGNAPNSTSWFVILKRLQ